MRWIRARPPALHAADLVALDGRVVASVGRGRFGWWAHWTGESGAQVTSDGFDTEQAAKKHAWRRAARGRE